MGGQQEVKTDIHLEACGPASLVYAVVTMGLCLKQGRRQGLRLDAPSLSSAFHMHAIICMPSHKPSCLHTHNDFKQKVIATAYLSDYS